MSTKKPPANAKRGNLDTDIKRQAVGFAHRLGFRQAASDFAVSKVNLRNWAETLDLLGTQAFYRRRYASMVVKSEENHLNDFINPQTSTPKPDTR